MKRILSLLLIILFILGSVSCSDTSEKKETEKTTESNATENAEEKTEPSVKLDIELPADEDLGGIKWDNGYMYIDESNPLLSIGNLEKEVTLSNGTTGISTLSLPYLDVYLEGAKEVSMAIYNNYSEKYGEYFKNPDDRIVNISYSYEIARDTLEILISEKVETPEGVSEMTYGYYYDILVDEALSMPYFVSVCSSAYDLILDALSETEWGKEYTKDDENILTENSFTALTFNEEAQSFTLYCTNLDGTTQTVVEVIPEELELDLSAMENTLTIS